MKNITEKTVKDLNGILSDIKENGISASDPYIYIVNDSCKINSKYNGVEDDELVVASGDDEMMDMVDSAPFTQSELIDYLETTEKI